MNLVILPKIGFSLILLIIFIFFFGIPSWKKFQAKEVMINQRKINQIEGITPAVTICALNTVTLQGWKYSHIKKENDKKKGNAKDNRNKRNALKDDEAEDDITLSNYRNSFLSLHCEGSQLLDDCINKETFNLTETIKFARAGGFPYRNIINTTFWIDELSFFGSGKCHTLNNSVSLGSSEFQFILYRSLTYQVFLHDPNYFMISANPSTIPNLYLEFDGIEGNQLVYIEAVRHINIDRPDQPCNNQKDYSFTACVKTSVSRKIGCR